jgi:polysaccharide export outer membrane protein
MITVTSPHRLALLSLGVAAALAAAGGCRPFDHYDHSLEQPVPLAIEPPREKAKMSLPVYQIEPPDLVSIEMLKMVPLPPYRTEIYDVLQVQVMGTLADQPIDGYFLVEAEGTVNLGPAYGPVRVAGMTIEEVTQVITQHLRQILNKPDVSVQLSRTAGTQSITGVYLVGPDGTVNLRQYGSVHIAGKTLVEARVALEKHLAQFFDSPEVSVDMVGYNSKVYYIITEGAGVGDNVLRVPITGNETVLDAICQVGGLSQLSSDHIWIARPAPGDFSCEQILPVNWDAITRGGSAATNYQVLPGDRVYIEQDTMMSANNFLAKVLGPVERLLGVTGLGASTIRGTQTMGRDFNRTRSV